MLHPASSRAQQITAMDNVIDLRITPNTPNIQTGHSEQIDNFTKRTRIGTKITINITGNTKYCQREHQLYRQRMGLFLRPQHSSSAHIVAVNAQ